MRARCANCAVGRGRFAAGVASNRACPKLVFAAIKQRRQIVQRARQQTRRAAKCLQPLLDTTSQPSTGQSQAGSRRRSAAQPRPTPLQRDRWIDYPWAAEALARLDKLLTTPEREPCMV